jgi:zinc protease
MRFDPRPFLVAAPVLCAPVAAQQATAPPAAQDRIPVDSAVTIGTLPNGLRYYIRENRRPEKRAELRLVVNASSVLEDDDQRGLAHFVEHMAFNGTAHFEKQALVDFLERSGIRFGAHLNAYTSFDETVYLLAVPTDTGRFLAQGIQILEDWAHGITFDTAEIRKERGVVIEEWRGGQGAGERLRQQQFPVLFRGSRYAERLPVGTKESLENFRPEALLRFYRDWYRPDLMAVVAVGDFDRKAVEQLIRQHFLRIPAAKQLRPRPRYGVPPRDSTAAMIVTDKEATNTTAQLYLFRGAARPRGTVGVYREVLVERLYSQMLNARLAELTQKPNPPFLWARSGIDHVVREAEALTLGAAVPDTGLRRGLETVLTEVERVDRYGFTETELARAKQNLLRGYERAYAEREKRESREFATEYVAHFLTGEPIPGIAQELELAKRLLESITAEEVAAAARGWLGIRHRVLLVSAPEGPGGVLPGVDSLVALFAQVRGAVVMPYEETVSDAPLVAAAVSEAAIVREARDTALNVTTWTLANGVRVILKPTDFKADEVLFTAYSPGGTSLVTNSLFTSAQAATQVVAAGGLGQFDAVELRKKLAGIVVRVDANIDTYEEGLAGGASSRDLETLFELIYLRFTAPRADTAAFQALRANYRTALANRSANPAAAFQDTLEAVLAQYHPRSRPFTVAQVDSIDLGKAMAVYRDRFADASDFTFVFVGSFQLDSVRPQVRRYLGNLPALKRGEQPRDLGMTPPTGVVQRTVQKGLEPIAQSVIVFPATLEYTRANLFALSTLAQLFEIKLREQLREEMGGTYGVGVWVTLARVPRPQYTFSIQFGSAPERVEELVGAVFAQIDSLRRNGAGAQELAKIKETGLRDWETALKENGFWLTHLAAAGRDGEDPREVIEELQSLLNRLTSESVREAAQKYLDPRRYVRVTLMPEGAGSK